jgi:hypothetical protein
MLQYVDTLTPSRESKPLIKELRAALDRIVVDAYAFSDQAEFLAQRSTPLAVA